MFWTQHWDVIGLQRMKPFIILLLIAIESLHATPTITMTELWKIGRGNFSNVTIPNIYFATTTVSKAYTQATSNFTSVSNTSTVPPTISVLDGVAARPLHQQILIGVAFGILSIVTIVGNLLVFVAFYKNPALRTITNYFLLSLAASDLLIGIFSINFYASFVIFNQWHLGPYICDAWLCMDYTCCQASVFNLVTICVDRYLSLTRPLTYRAKRTGSRTQKVIALIWVISFLEWSPMIVCYQFIQGKRTVPDDNCYIQFLTENAYLTFGTALLAYYIPVTLMGVLYVKIYLLTKQREGQQYQMTNGQSLNCKSLENWHGKQRAKVGQQICFNVPSQNRNADDNRLRRIIKRVVPLKILSLLRNKNSYSPTRVQREQNLSKTFDAGVKFLGIHINAEQRERTITSEFETNCIRTRAVSMISRNNKKAAKMISIIILAFFITWLPYDIFAIMMPFCPMCIPSDWWSFGYAFCYCNSTINPFCYALGNKTFADTFRSFVARRKGSERSGIAAVSSTQRVPLSSCDGTPQIGQTRKQNIENYREMIIREMERV